jgi:threonine synthase
MKWCVKNYGWFPLSGYVSPTIGSNCYAVDGYKTIAFELYEQLNGLPDFIVVPSAYSDGLFGIWKGLRDLYELGLSNKKCRMVAAEVGGSLKASLGKQTKELVEVPYKPSIAFSIANELGTWQGYTALKESDGIAETANDPEIIDMQLKLARTEGIYAETSSVSALVAVEKLVKQGTIRKDDEVVVVITSTGLKDPNETAKYLLDIPIIGANPKDLVEAAKKYYGLVI